MWQIVTIAVMLFLMIALKRLGISSFSGELRPESTVIAGFILVCSFTMGELFKRMRLPALLGYIAFGILFGPSLAALVFGSTTSALFGSEVISDLSLISVLTIGVIGTMGGGELKLSDVRANLKTILAILVLIFSLTFISITSLILLVSYLVPNKISFLHGVPFNEKLAAAILFAVLAVGMSPSATIAVLQDLRAKGSLTSLVLGIVVVLDLILVAAFLLCLSIAKLLASGSFELSVVLEVLPRIAAEFAWAVLLGAITGLVFILYLHYINKEMLLFTLLILFGASYVCSLLHAETLLAFLIAGFCVQNFSKHGHKMIHALEKISLPAFVLYFSIQAISLDLSSVPKYMVLTGLILTTRLAVFTLSIQLATKWVGTSENIRRNLWMCFYSQGGVDLVLAAMIPHVLTVWGSQLQVVIIATVVVYIILGPPLLKLALDRAGETEEARQRAKDEAAALDRAFTAEHSVIPANRLFPVPNFPDVTLNQKLIELRSRFVSFHERHIVQPSDSYNIQLNSLVQKIETASNQVFEQLKKILSEVGQQQRSIEQLKAEWRRSIQTEIAQIERVCPLPVTTSTAQKILSGVRGAVEFELMLDVEREEELFTYDSEDQLPKRLLKQLRRMRRSLLGPGYRSVQLGKLWRYYVELSTASYLASAASATARQNVLFWYSLGLHLRKVDRVFGELVEILKRKDASTTELVRATLQDEFVANQNRLRQIRDTLALAANLRLEKYTWGLQEIFHKFIHSVRRCGTLELPSFRYQPSSRFDKARRAEEHLKAILSREEKIVTGYRGWLLLDQQLALFNSEFIAYQNRVLAMLEEHLEGACRSSFDQLANTLSRTPQRRLTTGSQSASDGPSYWHDYVEEAVRPALTTARQSIEEALALFREGATRELFDLLEGIVHRFSDHLVMTLQDPDTEPSEAGSVETISLPVRQWFETKLVRDIAMRLVEFSERTESLLQRSLADLHRIQSIVEFNLVALQQDSDDLPTIEEKQMGGAMRRAAKQAEQTAETIRRETRELGLWIHNETAQILTKASQPFEQHRLQEVQREFTVRQTESWQPMATATRSFYQRMASLIRDLAEDVRERITDHQTALSREEFLSRVRLGRHDLQILPKAYRRLFLPLPLDIADFYVQRPTLEAHLQMALRQWLEGYPTSILIHGERGSGKRTLAQHLLHQNQMVLQNVLNRLEECTLLLEEETSTEEDICRQIAMLTGEDAVTSFEALTTMMCASEMKRLYIVENGEKLYERSKEGIRLCHAFMRMISATSDRVLWIVILGSPAATILQNTLGLYGYFTHRLEVDPMDLAGLEQLIQKRHRVSGFDLEFEQAERMVLRRDDGSPSRRFFQRLYNISHGNPLLALVYWLQSVHPVAGDEAVLRAVEPVQRPLVLTSDLTLEKRLLLAYLLQHSSLTRTQLARLLRWEHEQVESEIDHLVRLQLVEKITATADSYRVRPFLEPLIGRELRCQNLC